MGNNAEIRKRMETYRGILLVLNWIFAIALVIFGFVLASTKYTQGIGIGVILGGIIFGIIGHFLINVALAIPFILLNNGDILESQKSKSGSANLVGTVITREEESSENQVYTVITQTSLRGSPENNARIVLTLNVEDKVRRVNNHEYRKNGDTLWYYVATSDNREGYCISDHLRKV